MRLASNGRQFLATFADFRYGNADGLGWRYDENGQSIDEQAIPVVATWRNDGTPLAIWNGSDYAGFGLVDMVGAFRVRISPDGAVNAGGDPLPLSYGSPISGAWNGSRYCVAFVLYGGAVQVRFFDAALNQIGQPVTVGQETLISAAAVSTDGVRFLVVTEALAAQDDVITASVFDQGGAALSAPQTLWRETAPQYGSPSSGLGDASIAWNGSRYLVAWNAAKTLEFAFVDAAGSVSARGSIAAQVRRASVAVAWDGSAHAMTWSDDASGLARAALMTSTGEVLGTFDTGSPAARPAIASNGQIFLLLTASDRFALHSTGPERLVRLGSATAAFLPQSYPVLTGSGSALLVTWTEGGTIYASRINRDGVPADKDIALGSIYGPFAAATAGDSHLVTWVGGNPGAQFVARITASGTVIDRIDTDAGSHVSSIALASNGASFLLLTATVRNDYPYDETRSATVIPTRGPIPASAVYATNPYSANSFDALLWTGQAYALISRRYTAPPCVTSACLARPWHESLTTFSTAGAVVLDEAIPPSGPQAAFIAAAADEQGLLTVFGQEGRIVSQRIALDGTLGPTVPMPTSPAFLSGSLVPTASGFDFFLDQYSQYPATVQRQIALMRLDRSGHASGPPAVVRDDAMMGTDPVRAFGLIWLAWIKPWQPLPRAHEGVVARAFYGVVPELRRNVGRH